MKTDTRDFLNALLWAYPRDEVTDRNPFEYCRAADFTQEFQDACDRFIDGFKAYCKAQGIKIKGGTSLDFGRMSIFPYPATAQVFGMLERMRETRYKLR